MRWGDDRETGVLALARVLPHVRPALFSTRTRFWAALRRRMGERLGVNASWPDAIALITVEDVEGAFAEVAKPIRDELATAGFVRVDSGNTDWEIYHGASLTECEPPYELFLPLPQGRHSDAPMARDYEWKAREFLLTLREQRAKQAA
jgi:hypothetical protein